MQNKMEDIVNKTKTRRSISKNDMLSKLQEDRDKKSIPNNFQDRNTKDLYDDEEEDFEDKEDIVIPTHDIKHEHVVKKASKKSSNHRKNSSGFSERNNKVKLFLISLGFILVSLFFILNYFASVKIFIVPKVEKFSFNNEKFTTIKSSNSGLPFEVMVVEANEEKNVNFSEEKTMSTKAKGTVVIYNEYSTVPQKLLINTRLSDDNGLIYMTDKAITIPGYTKSGSKIVPGSITITVTAQNEGNEYNGKARDLKILGFKGTPKYEKMYARSKTDFEGGAKGTFYTPSAKEKGEINSELSLKLKDSLIKKIEAEIPEGYMNYPESVQFSVVINEESFISKTQDAKIVANAKVYTLIFKEEDILREFIKRAYPEANDMDFKEIDIPEIKEFKFNFSNKEYVITKDATEVSFELSGDGTLIWHPVATDLVNKLVGVNKKDMDSILKEDTGILKARVVFRPPWKRNFPENAEKIKIIEENL